MKVLKAWLNKVYVTMMLSRYERELRYLHSEMNWRSKIILVNDTVDNEIESLRMASQYIEFKIEYLRSQL